MAPLGHIIGKLVVPVNNPISQPKGLVSFELIKRTIVRTECLSMIDRARVLHVSLHHVMFRTMVSSSLVVRPWLVARKIPGTSMMLRWSSLVGSQISSRRMLDENVGRPSSLLVESLIRA